MTGRPYIPTPAHPDLLTRAVDYLVGLASPRAAIQRRYLRGVQASYRATQTNRMRVTRTGLGGSGERHLDYSTVYRMREYVRELERDNCLVDGILSRGVDNAISTGIHPQARTGSPPWNTKAEGLWESWAEDFADVTRQFTFYEFEQLGLRSTQRDGDVLFNKVVDPETGEGALQGLEGDRLASPLRSGALNVTNGIQFDGVGRPVNYYIAPYSTSGTVEDSKAEPYPAEQILFLARRKRLSQSRGVSIFHSCLEEFERIDDWIEAELIGAQTAAGFVMFLGSSEPYADTGRVVGEEDASGVERKVEEVEAGMLVHGKPGEVAEGIVTNRPNPEFPPFLRNMLRVVGCAIGYPLELITLDGSDTTYSSMRGVLMQAYRVFRGWQAWEVAHLCRPVYLWKMREWIAAGKLSKRSDWMRHDWNLPDWEWIDPLKEAEADALAVDRGFKTLSTIAQRVNRDWEQLLAQRAREIGKAKQEAAGLGGDVTWRDLIGGKAAAPALAPAASKTDPRAPANKTDEEAGNA